MDIGSVNHEVAFCKVYDMATKEKVERILLKNRISYYVEWEDKGFGGLFMFRKPKDKTACVFRIHSDEVARAKELLRSVLGSKAKEAGKEGGEEKRKKKMYGRPGLRNR